MSRMGSRERMQRLALEKELEAKEKAEKVEAAKLTGASRKTSTRKTSSAASATGGRMKMVWQVYDPSMKEIAVFPYPQKTQAEAKAAELTEKKGKEYGVRSIQVPMD